MDGLHFRSPQPDTSLCSETMDTWLMHRVMCLFMPQLMISHIFIYF